MHFRVTERGERHLVVKVIGHMSYMKTEAPLTGIQEVIGDDGFGLPLLLDLSEATSLATSGTDWLKKLKTRVGERGGRLLLCAVPELVRHMLRLLQLDPQFEIVDSVANAKRRLAA